ncbi:hypothetical protein L9F63_009057, partial [Diploptera punctata]
LPATIHYDDLLAERVFTKRTNIQEMRNKCDTILYYSIKFYAGKRYKCVIECIFSRSTQIIKKMVHVLNIALLGLEKGKALLLEYCSYFFKMEFQNLAKNPGIVPLALTIKLVTVILSNCQLPQSSRCDSPNGQAPRKCARVLLFHLYQETSQFLILPSIKHREPIEITLARSRNYETVLHYNLAFSCYACSFTRELEQCTVRRELMEACNMCKLSS